MYKYKRGYIMKTNHLMLKELLKVYHPETRGFVSYNERRLIEKTLHLADMDILALRNLRDFVVLYCSQSKDHDDWDKMSAITHVIDMEISYNGGIV